jgi:hypothetical protein
MLFGPYVGNWKRLHKKANVECKITVYVLT